MIRIRNRHLLFLDVLLITAAPFLLYVLRFEGVHWQPFDRETVLVFAPVNTLLAVLVFVAFGLYRRLWRYASVSEVERILAAGTTAAVISFILGAVILPDSGLTPQRVPLSVLFSNALLMVFIAGESRLLIRMAARTPLRGRRASDGKRVLIAGAGAAGHLLVRELHENPQLRLYPVGFVDDDATKHGMHLSDLPVLGPLSETADIIRDHKIDALVVAMPTAPGSVVRPLVQAALDAGIETRAVPGLSEIISGKVSVSALREVEIQDLLRREPIETDLAGVGTMITDRTVLVTGAGGSIGSELCRQIAQLNPAKLVIVGRGENPIFEILHELRPVYPALHIVPVIADVRDRQRLLSVFDRHRPHSVFHAAAHKHVPLMEENVIEAVTNNVIGTRNMVDACVDFDVQHFVLISTDKAVRPTNVMGASKRVAEHIVQETALTTGKNFVAVRFGNVLGSRGSVVPTFVRQIKSGGPVTVTHPEMRRFFMTIPEAVQLVLQAGALGRCGELFMLDMGEPVRVVDLARDLIRLSGLEEGEDIEIKFTGIRAGEKLYEEMFFSDEQAAPTEHPKVLRARRKSLENHGSHLIGQLMQAAREGADEQCLRELLRAIVPDFAPAGTLTSETPSFGVPIVPVPTELHAPAVKLTAAASGNGTNGNGRHAERHRREEPARRISEEFPRSAEPSPGC